MSAVVIMSGCVVIASVSGSPLRVSSSIVRAKLSCRFWTRGGVVPPLMSICFGDAWSAKSVTMTCVCWNASSKNRIIFSWYCGSAIQR